MDSDKTRTTTIRDDGINGAESEDFGSYPVKREASPIDVSIEVDLRAPRQKIEQRGMKRYRDDVVDKIGSSGSSFERLELTRV